MNRLLVVVVLALPVWWLLGVEQFVWFFLFAGLSFGISLARRWKVVFDATLVLYSVFVSAYLLSGFAITSGPRWISYSRSLGTFLVGMLVVYYLTNQLRDWASIRALVVALACLGVLVSVVGLVGVLGVWRPELSSPLGLLLPGWIVDSDYGRLLAVRSIGRQGFLPGIGRYYRPTSLFLYPTLFATALVVLLPLNLFSIRLARSWPRKVLAAAGALLVVSNLILATSRTAWLAALLGLGYHSTLYARQRWLYRSFLLTAIGGVLALVLVLPAALPDVAASVRDTATTLRGAGDESRLEVYRTTFAGIRERPLVGWGTERDVAELTFPAGSHSFYLALLYRHGVVGLLTFAVLMAAMWLETRPGPPCVADSQSQDMRDLLAHGRSIQIAVAVSGLTTVMITDATVMMLWMMAVSLLLATKKLLDERLDPVGAP